MGNDRNRNACYFVERSIIVDFRGKIWRRFLAAIQQYDLIQGNDAIAVCLSGGKDSFLLAKCMQILHRHTSVPFTLKFMAMDPGYSEENRRRIIENAAALEIPIEIFNAEIFPVVEQVKSSPCHVCACMRRGFLYKEAQARGCNKIALGHHMDDVTETILLGMMYCGEFKTMLPKLRSRNFSGMELIRPLYQVREADIIAWKDLSGTSYLDCACRVTRQETGGKRLVIKKLLHELERCNSNVVSNIFSSIQSINLDTLLAYRPGEGMEKVSYLDKYKNTASDREG